MKKKVIIAVIVILALVIAGFGGYSVYKSKQIEKMQNVAMATVEEMYSIGDYRDAEQNELETLKAKANENIQAVKTQEEADSIVAAFKEDAGKLKTDAQYKKEEKKAAEEAARKKAEAEAKAKAEAAAKAAAQAKWAKAKKAKKSKKKSKKKKKSGSGGCVSDDAANFY